MTGINKFKEEFKEQKKLIEKKGGKVVVKNDYPSPSEILEGIETIDAPEFALATATESDVVMGKTFFSQSSELKTGTGIFDKDMMNNIFMVNYQQKTTNERIYYSCPAGLKLIKKNSFYFNYNPIHITFNPELTKIESYAFYYAQDFEFEGLENASGLTSIEMYAFAYTSLNGLDFANLPDSLTNIGEFCFYDCEKAEFTDIKIPPKCNSIGMGIFKQIKRKQANSFDSMNSNLVVYPHSMLYNIAFRGDLIMPEGFLAIRPYFNYNGTFRNIVFPTTINNLENFCFGADSAESLSNFNLETVTFLKETPPTFGYTVFAPQNIENGFKIYVPDNAVEEYKAVPNLSSYVDCIYPMSQKE